MLDNSLFDIAPLPKLEPDIDLLKARIFHGLKKRLKNTDSLNHEFLEEVICEVFGFKHVGSEDYYADGTRDGQQLSVKTKKIDSKCFKTKVDIDFQSSPDHFLGSTEETNGVEIIQRRQQIFESDELNDDAEIVGKEVIKLFEENICYSERRYNASETFEVIGIHGVSKNKNQYIVSLYFKKAENRDLSNIKWQRHPNCVAGYNNNGLKIYERINGNHKYKATCFIEYKNLLSFPNSVHIKIPIPQIQIFEKDKLLAEILDIEKQNESIFFE